MAEAGQVKVLVDTPVWIDHMHRSDATLQRLLATGIVYVAGPILGELAAGSLPNRRRTLADLRLMRRFDDPTCTDVLDWLETKKLGGKGLSWIDCLLLWIARENGATIYTRDRILAREAEALALAFTE
ncbi:MAG: PIN domain-containing protein [Chthoniobacterales bacterium]